METVICSGCYNKIPFIDAIAHNEGYIELDVYDKAVNEGISEKMTDTLQWYCSHCYSFFVTPTELRNSTVLITQLVNTS